MEALKCQKIMNYKSFDSLENVKKVIMHLAKLLRMPINHA